MSSSSSTSPPATAELPAQASQLAVTGGVLIAAAIFLLTAAVFALLLYLYAKRYRGAIPLLSSPSSPRLLIAGSSPIPRRGLAASALRSLPVGLHAAAASSAEPLECAVCLSEVGDGEKVRLLPTCGHGFHVGCIDMWFHSHATCPLCRAAVGPAEEKEPHVLPPSESVPDSATTDEVSDAELPPPVASSLSESARGEETPQLVIDIPRRAVEGAFFPASVTGAGPEDATRSPVSATLKSLTRLLSRGKQGLAGPSCSPRAPTGDIEEGAAVSAALPSKTPKNSPPS